MRPYALLSIVLAVGCSSSSDPPAGPCAERTGTFLVHFTYRSGECNAPPDEVIVADNQTKMAAAMCTGEDTRSADNCKVTIDHSCPVMGVGQLKETGTATWTSDGVSASGTIQITEIDGAGHVLCDGVYDVTFTKQ